MGRVTYMKINVNAHERENETITCKFYFEKYSNVDKFISLIKDSYKEMSKRNMKYRIFFHRDNYI